MEERLEATCGAKGADFHLPLPRTFISEQVNLLKRLLLRKLKLILLSINGVLDDAEGEQITNSAVKEWIDELRDAAYDADDLLDEIYTRAKKSCRSEVQLQNRNSTSCNSNDDKELEETMKDIIERLEFIAKQKDVLGLKGGVGVKLSQKTPTTSLVEGSDVYGREDDKEVIMKLLLDVTSADDKKIGVIPIVGMAGIGKTTLAQLVYNDDGVKQKFDLRAWICISEEFNIFKVTKTVLEAVSSCKYDTLDLDTLQLELKERLMGKKFLFVLDDVWNDNYVDWDRLKIPFQYGAQGSKIIVTTQSEHVASIMQTVPSYRLSCLSDEDCWELFAKHAFDYKNSSSYPVLEQMGKDIAEKCKGLPLAAKALGGLLRSKTKIKEWENVLNSDLWDLSSTMGNVLPALRLSYHHLPSHLKRCFSYCSIFPKGYEFDKEELILLWMAENLLKKPKRNKRVEEVGHEYFHDLVCRCFFQQSRNDESLFVMHDLINDLAQSVSGKFCVRLENHNSAEDVEKHTHHLSQIIASRYPSLNFEAFYKANRVRTFLQLSLVDPPICFLNKVPHDLLKNLRCLRVLSLVGARGSVNELLHFIGKLRHLRYLDVSQTRIKKLPNSICTLYNLQTLKAARCPSLTKLPRNMHCLVNLRYLDVKGTTLEGMPLQIHKLRSLQNLSNFIVGKEHAASIGELGELSNLRDSLLVQNLKYLVDPEDAMKANLKEKKCLEQLTLDWGKGADTDNSQHEKDVLDKLQPHANLEVLNILHYTGTQFPTWLGDHSFFHLVCLSLRHCKYCYMLPPLGQLPALKELHLSKFKELVSVGPEFYGFDSCKGKQPFPSLEVLTFYSMPAWERWIHQVDHESCRAFPRLRELHMEECPRLAGNLPSYLPSLTNLTMRYCKQLESSIPNAPSMRLFHIDNCWKLEFLDQINGSHKSLESLEIHNSCHSLKSFPLDLFPNLKSLVIWGCENLESLTASRSPREGTLEHLNSLCIWRCPSFVTFPEEGLPTPNLTSLKVRYCDKLKSLPQGMHSLLSSLKELQVWRCPGIESFPHGGLPISLNSLKIRDCDKLIDQRKDWNLQYLTSLVHFSVEGKCEEVKSFPEEGLLPNTVKQLEIHGFSNLKTLDWKGLQHLKSLKKLQIFDCSKLESIEEGTLPASSVDVDIWKCPLLQEQWERKNGQQWPKFSDNPGIWINDKYMELDGKHYM
ncbi:putative disease resistance protein At3g14460 [Prosopis cineraria]|uniref:putative disease resistance protein At3g14460 n=1 Tax=Prosopis cineraria TaxID=364024 RepID=UPI00240F563F|nr:putative disease resistance protein At3g14460 [Prosopis cineraria]